MPSWPTGMTLDTLIALLPATANAALANPLQQILSQLKWITFKHERRPLTDMEAFDDASREIREATGKMLRSPKRSVWF